MFVSAPLRRSAIKANLPSSTHTHFSNRPPSRLSEDFGGIYARQTLITSTPIVGPWYQHLRETNLNQLSALIVRKLSTRDTASRYVPGYLPSHNLVQPPGLIGALSDAYRTIWLAFETYARKRLRFLNDDELKCNRSSTTRCSNCWEAAYCSKECHMTALNIHGIVCTAQTNVRQNCGSSFPAAENVQFALRVAQHDF
ncbi:hypothetical protein DFH08DRAFT_963617 [Mycena albidolilacea]|uniref:MYND-type domain-containing protein n=1 Tax=Mycena albidolilacea TaxID=1033008 RepID=A0AAD6ZV04_9AGAR|nr:hypothetical protein DFH08DRAFT_963617 [Mycena albidolilacea]